MGGIKAHCEKKATWDHLLEVIKIDNQKELGEKHNKNPLCWETRKEGEIDPNIRGCREKKGGPETMGFHSQVRAKG